MLNALPGGRVLGSDLGIIFLLCKNMDNKTNPPKLDKTIATMTSTIPEDPLLIVSFISM